MSALGHSQQSRLEQHLVDLYDEATDAFDQRRFVEAEAQARRLVQMQQRARGFEHSDTLDCMTLHALALEHLGRAAEAEAIFREVLQIKQQSPSFGIEHPFTLLSVTSLGNFLLGQGRWREAEAMLRKVHATHVRVLGPAHEDTILIQVALGKCLTNNDNQLEEAERLLRGALEGYQAMEGAGDVDEELMLRAMEALGGCLLKARDYGEAEAVYRSAVRCTNRCRGEHCSEVLYNTALHGKALTGLGMHAEAEVLFQQVFEGARALNGWEHHATLDTMRLLIRSLQKQRKPAAAESLLRGTLGHLQQTLGKGHPTTVQWVRHLAVFLKQQSDQGKNQKAAAALRARLRQLALSRNGQR